MAEKKRKAPKERPETTPSLGVIRAKLGLRGKGKAAGKAHGKIVRVRLAPRPGESGDDIGEKAVYLNPQGKVELRQG